MGSQKEEGILCAEAMINEINAPHSTRILINLTYESYVQYEIG